MKNFSEKRTSTCFGWSKSIMCMMKTHKDARKLAMKRLPVDAWMART
jgi:hypothetical protein